MHLFLFKDAPKALVEKVEQVGQHRRSKKQLNDRPYFLCEYAHAMENSLGNFKEYVDDFENYDHMCGGFIWDYVDQSIRKVENGQEKWLYGGDFGEGATSFYFCANGIITADRMPQPSYYEVKKVYSNLEATDSDCKNGKIIIKNKNLFISTEDYRILWSLTVDGNEVKMTLKVGDKVKRGDTIAILEAMKMENSMTSNYEGTVKQILVEVGQAVAAGTILAEVE